LIAVFDRPTVRPSVDGAEMDNKARKALQARRAEVAQAREARRRAAALDAASGLPRDVLAAAGLGALAAFSRGGLELELACTAPGLPSWTPQLEAWALALTRANMRPLYEQAARRDSSWRWRDAAKRAELFDAESRFLVARERRRRPRPADEAGAAAAAADAADAEGRAGAADAAAAAAAGKEGAAASAGSVAEEAGGRADCAASTTAAAAAAGAGEGGGGGGGSSGGSCASSGCGSGGGDGGGVDGDPVAFLCFRFVLEGALEVLYVYELQLEERAQRRGLGRHLMMCAELAARKLGMQAVVLTVLKANASALAFYTQRMKYAPDADSPSQCGDPDAAHEILSKVVDKAAHAAALALVEEGAIVVD